MEQAGFAHGIGWDCPWAKLGLSMGQPGFVHGTGWDGLPMYKGGIAHGPGWICPWTRPAFQYPNPVQIQLPEPAGAAAAAALAEQPRRGTDLPLSAQEDLAQPQN